MKTYKCDDCGLDYQEDDNIQYEFNGIMHSNDQYRELMKDNKNVWFVCKSCLDKMPDAGHFFESGDFTAVPNPEKIN